MQMTQTELRDRVFEVETARGVHKGEHPSLLACSPKKYLFVLLWTDPETIILNKTEWAKAQGFNRTEVYQYLGDRRVVEAIKYLDVCIHSV